MVALPSARPSPKKYTLLDMVGLYHRLRRDAAAATKGRGKAGLQASTAKKTSRSRRRRTLGDDAWPRFVATPGRDDQSSLSEASAAAIILSMSEIV
jgi:hypothetical protein